MPLGIMACNNVEKTYRSEERLVVEDPKQRTRIISSVHDSSHLGLKRTNDLLACKYYWPGMSKYVASYVSLLSNTTITVKIKYHHDLLNADGKL